MQKQLQIATTIREQLYAGGRKIVWSWGAHEWQALPETREYDGGLQFRVKGRLYNGPVHIWLAYDDTYTIKLKDKAAKELKNIYCNQLTEVVDSLVETA